MLFDTHTHINVEQFKDEVPQIIQSAMDNGVTNMAVVGFDEETIIKSLQLSQQYDHIYSIVGWHPVEAGSYTTDIEKRLQNDWLTQPKVVALGEIGLDYHWMTESPQVQEKVFRRQIALSREMNLPIVIHTREALEDTYRILKSERFSGGIMHSFSGSVEDMKRFLDLGMHISLSGVVTFKKSLDLQEVAKVVPSHKLLLETDAPYLSPVPKRGKRNEPAYVRYVAEFVAQLRGCTLEELAKQTTQNAKELFRL